MENINFFSSHFANVKSSELYIKIDVTYTSKSYSDEKS